MRPHVLVALGIAAAGVVATGTPGHARPPAFTAPLRLTEPGFGGYEPSIKVDRHGNVFVTAHKANHTVLLGKDPHGPVPVRAASFLWHSSDDGRSFGPLPGVTAARENSLWPAAEGDFAVDGADHLYFVDTYVGDNSITRWTLGGRGEVTADFSRPVQGTAGGDDRPWLSAHGDGVVMYLGNGAARVPVDGASGRYTAYMSYDGGLTFDPVGVNLPGSGWCEGAADPRAGSRRLYVVCGSDGGTLYAYTSGDDGRTFTRKEIGSYPRGVDGTETYPAVAVGRDGTVRALFNLAPDATEEAKGEGTRLVLFSTADGGATWRRADITPRRGFHHFSWLDVAADGRIGVAYYYRADDAEPWVLYAGSMRPGRRLTTTPIADVTVGSAAEPHGDFFQAAFGPDSKLHVAYTALVNSDGPIAGPDVYYVRER